MRIARGSLNTIGPVVFDRQMNSTLTSSKWEILQTLRLPGRIDARQTATLLGFQVHDIPVLVVAKLLLPLGNPSQTAPKWYSSAEIDVLRQNPKFLAKATRTVALSWKKRNQRNALNSKQISKQEEVVS